jgi:hypothetical protein
MKKLLALSLIGSSLLIGSNPAKADWDVWTIKESATSGVWDIYTLNSATQEATKRTQVCTNNTAGCPQWYQIYVDPDSLNRIFVQDSAGGDYSVYDVSTDTWTDDDSAAISSSIWIDDYNDFLIRNIVINNSDGSSDIYDKGTFKYKINSDGSLRIGSNTSDFQLNSSSITSGSNNIISKKTNGDIHIGKNSFVVGADVLNGAHPIWAEDENGSKIPLNIYGSDLEINGKSVQGQIDTNKSNINNLGSGVAGSTALTAALTALPQTSKESKLSCGVGTGAYSSRYALGFGCASKVNERVDINAGGSYVFGGSKSYGGGTLDSGVVKAGFVFKLGELNKSQKISKTEKEKLESKIGSLEEKNKQLLARLERLEKVALGDLKSKDLAVYKLQ